MRFLADIPDEDVKWLDRLAKEQGKSRAAVLREAVAAYRAEAPDDWIERGFGLWKDRTDIGDAVDCSPRRKWAAMHTAMFESTKQDVTVEMLRHVVAPHPSVNQIWNPLLARKRQPTEDVSDG